MTPLASSSRMIVNLRSFVRGLRFAYATVTNKHCVCYRPWRALNPNCAVEPRYLPPGATFALLYTTSGYRDKDANTPPVDGRLLMEIGEDSLPMYFREEILCAPQSTTQTAQTSRVKNYLIERACSGRSKTRCAAAGKEALGWIDRSPSQLRVRCQSVRPVLSKAYSPGEGPPPGPKRHPHPPSRFCSLHLWSSHE